MVIASDHPVAPALATLFFCLASTSFFLRPPLALTALIVLLPVLNFSPWTGWLIVDEFDLLVLSVLAAGYFRMFRERLRLHNRRVFLGVLIVAVLWVVRVVSQIDVSSLSAFADYGSPMNGLRVAKSVLWMVLLIPLLSPLLARSPHPSGGSTCKETPAGVRQFLGACLISVSIVILAILWERAFYPGLFDFATPYRTVALFWEMHVGGAALDVFLVLMAPLLLWAWRSARSNRARVACGTLILAFVYGSLTSNSRALVAATAGAMFILTLMLFAQRARERRAARWFSLTGGTVIGLVALEVLLIAGAGSYLNERLSASERDFGGRIQHWQRGLHLLDTPSKWLFGIGLGALPEALARGDGGVPLAGAIRLDTISGRQVVMVSGPDSTGRLRAGDGFYFLSQRVNPGVGQGYRLALEASSERDADVLVKLCATHLLYPAHCRDRIIHLVAGDWQRRETGMLRPPFDGGDWRAFGHEVLMLAVLTPEATVRLGRIELLSGRGNLIRNGRFQDGLATWFPLARFYYLPWHIDNLYLEILVEAGLFGLMCFAAAVSLVVRQCVRAVLAGNPVAPYFLSSLCGLLALGIMISVLDMPRVAILFGLFLFAAWKTSRGPITAPVSQSHPSPEM